MTYYEYGSYKQAGDKEGSGTVYFKKTNKEILSEIGSLIRWADVEIQRAGLDYMLAIIDLGQLQHYPSMEMEIYAHQDSLDHIFHTYDINVMKKSLETHIFSLLICFS